MIKRCFCGYLPYCSQFPISNTLLTGQLLKGTLQCKNHIDKKFVYQWPIVKQHCFAVFCCHAETNPCFYFANLQILINANVFMNAVICF